MKVLMIAFGHPDNVFSLSKALSGTIDFNLIFFVSGNQFEEGVLDFPLHNLKFGLNSQEISFQALPGNIKKYLTEGFKIRIFRSYDRKFLRDKLLRNFRLVLGAVPVIKRENYDIIHYNGISGIMLYFVLLLQKSKKVWTLHDYIHHTGEKNKKAFNFQKVLLKFDFHFIQHYKFLKIKFTQFYKLPEDKVSYVPTGPLSIFNSFESEIPISSFTNYILFFGRISKYKGVDYLIPAFHRISKDFPTVKLIIAGNGELWFQHEKTENVIFINRYIKTNELVDLIKKSLFVVVPYTDATHSAVVATSYAFQKPVIASNVGGLSEVVKDGLTGYLVEPKESNELASKMSILLRDQKLLETMSKEIELLTTSGEYGWEQISNKMRELYSSILTN